MTDVQGTDLQPTDVPGTAVPPRPASFAAPKGVPEYYPPDSAGFEHVRDTLQAAEARSGKWWNRA